MKHIIFFAFFSICFLGTKAQDSETENQNLKMEQKKRIENGEPSAMYALGSEYDKAKKYNDALIWYERAAEKGHVLAMRYTAFHYYQEYYKNQDFKKAFFWFQKALDGGDTYSETWLGEMYLNGRGTNVNIEKGLLYLNHSAENGESYAMDILSGIYADGLYGVKKNKKLSDYWNSKSKNYK